MTSLLGCISRRLSLSEGCFLTPLPSQSPAVNACAVCPAHGLFAAAGEDGKLECFDLRQRRSAGVIDAVGAAGAVGLISEHLGRKPTLKSGECDPEKTILMGC